ncbi:hypothetical protein [Pseudomonas fontis]|uniref:Uncharacterized protein n=1 Tax=Pseudomonas fontis TaxID=2942633 RepID=A0ABT5NXR4_9PSED|nr:hypothetical protein [Pseudomonas fontis]MDD0974032.1 hypothetical protein [Pseudomonas fontis]MDD0992883.1 hypothetical protein [Pseudomonas fontis]
MSRWHLELLCSADLQPILEKVGRSEPLNFAELHLLYDAAEIKLFRLMQEYEGLHELRQLQQDSADFARLLQTSCLALRRANLSSENRQRARDVLEYQLAYQRACLQRSVASFDGG